MCPLAACPYSGIHDPVLLWKRRFPTPISLDSCASFCCSVFRVHLRSSSASLHLVLSHWCGNGSPARRFRGAYVGWVGNCNSDRGFHERLPFPSLFVLIVHGCCRNIFAFWSTSPNPCPCVVHGQVSVHAMLNSSHGRPPARMVWRKFTYLSRGGISGRSFSSEAPILGRSKSVSRT